MSLIVMQLKHISAFKMHFYTAKSGALFIMHSTMVQIIILNTKVEYVNI